ncbi:Transcription factor NFX1 family like protein, partial [Aduncisulcus paluster]
MQLQRSISSQLEEAPRSKPSQPKVWTCPSCRHKFPQSDESTTTSSCYCGATTQHITDFDRRGGKKSTKSKAILRTSHLHDSSFPHSCGNICGKVLDCGLHRCRLPCHPGECYSCSAPPHSCQCMCGKEPREVGCEIIASVRERERRAGGSDGYSGEWLNLKRQWCSEVSSWMVYGSRKDKSTQQTIEPWDISRFLLRSCEDMSVSLPKSVLHLAESTYVGCLLNYLSVSPQESSLVCLSRCQKPLQPFLCSQNRLIEMIQSKGRSFKDSKTLLETIDTHVCHLPCHISSCLPCCEKISNVSCFCRQREGDAVCGLLEWFEEDPKKRERRTKAKRAGKTKSKDKQQDSSSVSTLDVVEHEVAFYQDKNEAKIGNKYYRRAYSCGCSCAHKSSNGFVCPLICHNPQNIRHLNPHYACLPGIPSLKGKASHSFEDIVSLLSQFNNGNSCSYRCGHLLGSGPKPSIVVSEGEKEESVSLPSSIEEKTALPKSSSLLETLIPGRIGTVYKLFLWYVSLCICGGKLQKRSSRHASSKSGGSDFSSTGEKGTISTLSDSPNIHSIVADLLSKVFPPCTSQTSARCRCGREKVKKQCWCINNSHNIWVNVLKDVGRKHSDVSKSRDFAKIGELLHTSFVTFLIGADCATATSDSVVPSADPSDHSFFLAHTLVSILFNHFPFKPILSLFYPLVKYFQSAPPVLPPVLCTHVCRRKMSCGAHVCNVTCCPGGKDQHECIRQCGKELPCGHKCLSFCHGDSPCPPCSTMIDKPLRCDCGAVVLRDKYLCSSSLRGCGRYYEVPCVGGHENMVKIKCGDDPKNVICNEKCNKLLKCGRHKCGRKCHAGPCFGGSKMILTETESGRFLCSQDCNTIRKDCGHKCQYRCHEDPCEDKKCEAPVILTCKCGAIKITVKCGSCPENPGFPSHGHDVDSEGRIIMYACTAACDIAKRRLEEASPSSISGSIESGSSQRTKMGSTKKKTSGLAELFAAAAGILQTDRSTISPSTSSSSTYVASIHESGRSTPFHPPVLGVYGVIDEVDILKSHVVLGADVGCEGMWYVDVALVYPEKEILASIAPYEAIHTFVNFARNSMQIQVHREIDAEVIRARILKRLEGMRFYMNVFVGFDGDEIEYRQRTGGRKRKGHVGDSCQDLCEICDEVFADKAWQHGKDLLNGYYKLFGTDSGVPPSTIFSKFRE